MVRNKLEGKDKLTPWEQFLEKKKEKKRLKKKQKVSVLSAVSYLLNTDHHKMHGTVISKCTMNWNRLCYLKCKEESENQSLLQDRTHTKPGKAPSHFNHCAVIFLLCM